MNSTMIFRLNIDWAVTTMNYGPQWKAHRKLFHQYFNKTLIPKYAPVIEYQTLRFLRRLLDDPKEFLEITK